MSKQNTIRFNSLSPKDSKFLDRPIFFNAKKLKKDAITIAHYNKSYSTATSLLVLSSEELIKAILVLLHSNGYKVYELSDAGKFFKDHKIRHQIAQIIETGTGLIEAVEKWKKSASHKSINTESQTFNYIMNGIMNILSVIPSLFSSIDIIKHLQNFNDLKNQGFYVDYINELIVPAQTVNEVHYKTALNISNRLSKYYKLLNILLHPRLENHLDKTEINQQKWFLKNVIEDGMKDFSFKELNNVKL